MKIAIITDAIYPFTLGGSEIRNHEIAKRLVKKGHEVYIIGAKLWKGPDKIKIEGINILGISNFEGLYDREGKRNYLDQLRLSIRLFFRLLKKEFDVIDNLSFVFLNCYSIKLVSIIKSKPLIFTWQQYFGNYLQGYFGKLMGNFAVILERYSTKLTQNHIAVSSFVKNELIERGVKEKNITIIYNGSDIKQINFIKPQKKKYDLIYVGRLNYQKNLPLLIKSVSLIKNIIPKIKICIIGEGEEREKLNILIDKYNLKENFIFTGKIRDKNKIYKYYKSSRIFVLPSKLEGFPLTIIEANACGLPIITTKTKHNNTTEYIKNNINGLVIKPNPRDFVNAILKLLKNQKLRKKMSKQGIKKAKNFDWNKIANQQEKYYKKIIKNET